jgi:hypothetical protein
METVGSMGMNDDLLARIDVDSGAPLEGVPLGQLLSAQAAAAPERPAV